MALVGIDFETFYQKGGEYSVKDLGNWRYCQDERFDAYLMACYDGKQSWVGPPSDFNWDALQGEDLVAHNAGFERAVSTRLHELGKAPDLSSNAWHCSANMTSCLAGTRSLSDAMLVLEHTRLNKGIRDEMSGKRWADLTPEKKDQLAKYCLDDTIHTYNLFKKYSPRWSAFEQQLSELTMRQCVRGVAINVDLLREYRSKLQDTIFNLVKSFPWTATGGKPTSPIAIAEECRKVGIPCPPIKTHDEEGAALWLATYGPKYPWCHGAGQWRQLNKLLSTLDTMLERLRPDNTIDYSLLYFGSHTGRFSGGGSGLNLQNLRKVPIFLSNGNLIEPPVGLKQDEFKQWVAANTDYALDVRKLIIPRPGKKFIISDLAQIEPRVLAWLAGDTELLSLLSSGMSIYEAFARTAMDWTGGELKKENADIYQLAKIQVLGLGFGCAWEKFKVIAAGYGVTLTDDQSKDIVVNYRKRSPKITALWYRLDQDLRRSVNKHYELGLPSGRTMTYRDVLLQSRMKKNRETGEPEKRNVITASIGLDRFEFWGSTLAENATQATAREVFATHILELENQNIPVALHIHDEAMCEVDHDVKPADVEQIMSVCPEWLEGCPISAEAKEAPHYLK